MTDRVTVLINPTTGNPTAFEPSTETPLIRSGQYQNVTEVSADWIDAERRRLDGMVKELTAGIDAEDVALFNRLRARTGRGK